MALALEKKTVIGAKVTTEQKKRILGRCDTLSCSTSDYLKTLIEKDLAGAQAAEPAGAKEVVQGKVSPKTYIVERAGSALKATAIVIEGKEYKYCDQCKKYYRRDDSGRIEYYGPL